MFERLNEFKLKCAPGKSQFATTKLPYLEHLIKCHKPTPDKHLSTTNSKNYNSSHKEAGTTVFGFNKLGERIHTKLCIYWLTNYRPPSNKKKKRLSELQKRKTSSRKSKHGLTNHLARL